MNRLKVALLSLMPALVTLLLVANVAAAQKTSNAIRFEPYVFETEDKQKVDAELGFLTVPENRGDPRSRMIELAFVRFKSTRQNAGAPVVYLTGGPGGSGISTARGSRFPLFMAMREIGDVIALDQRGVGRSKPNLSCRQTLDYPLDRAGKPEEYLRLYREKTETCANYWRSQGVDLAAYNTEENADDLESLRVALGAEKINLWSISYGTHLALAAIKRHGNRINRAILAGVEGLDQTYKLPANTQQQLELINELAKRDTTIRAQIPDLISLMRSVHARLEREPMTVEISDRQTKGKVKVTISSFDLQAAVANTLGSPEVAYLPAAYYAMSQGDFSIAAEQIAQLRRRNIGSMMAFMMDCASGASKERLRLIERQAKETLLGDVVNFPFPGVCAGLGARDLGDEFRASPRSKVPVLFISGTLDARTPPSNAEEVRKGFPNSAHLIIEGAVHSDPLFLSSPKIKDVMLEFLKDQSLSTTRITLPPFEFFWPRRETSAPAVQSSSVASWVKGMMGYRITSVVPASQAEQAGLKEADIITNINGAMLGASSDLMKLTRNAPGSSIEIVYYRRNPSTDRYESNRATIKTNESSAIQRGQASAPEQALEQATGIKGRLGFMITSVEVGSLAQRAELREGDFIVKINDAEIKSANDLLIVEQSAQTDMPVEIFFIRYDAAQNKYGLARSRRRFRR
ncbi:MAG: alpha/beta fold hydrolase [Pyrinomonadaceae bacterium]|nr:alpha/beta fold hydrolase [Pyrinomonadaceae bacterium]